jgi:hypothetical protein
MKRPNWNEGYPIPIQQINIQSLEPGTLQPGRVGRGFLGDVTVYLEILKNHENRLFEAKVIDFDPPTAKVADLQITDEVEIDILHFLPGR